MLRVVRGDVMRNHKGARARNLWAATLWCDAGFWDSTCAICLVLWPGSRLEFLSTVVGGGPNWSAKWAALVQGLCYVDPTIGLGFSSGVG